jgi:hypothetical protein
MSVNNGNDSNAATSLTPDDLRQFTGTDNWYRHWMGKILYTDGVKHFAETVGGYWFIDLVGSVWDVISGEDFVNIEMTVKNGKANIVMDDGDKGDGEKTLYQQSIEFTDCPEGVWKFYLEGNVLLLPSEH